jgi:hypothetical protein
MLQALIHGLRNCSSDNPQRADCEDWYRRAIAA